MKKWLSFLGIITCVFALTACGSSSTAKISGDAVDQSTEQQLVSVGEQLTTSIESMDKSDAEQLSEQQPALKSGLESWESAKEDIGDIKGFQNEYAVVNDNEYSVNIGIDGSDHDANVIWVLTMDQNTQEISSLTVNVSYSFGELMEQAALNTVLGMGTTFVVLIILAFLISLFKFIPALQASLSRKKEEPVPEPVDEPKEEAAEQTAGEAVADDGALIAVIAAAVAASEGHTTTDGFVVRSVRKTRKRF